MSAHILVVDDDRSMCELIEVALRKRGFRITWLTSADEAFQFMNTNDVDVVVTDLNMRGMTGLDLCERVAVNRPDVPVVVITGFGSLETAVAAIRAGAYDFITKPFEMDVLKLTLDRAVQHRVLREEVTRLRRAVSESRHFNEIVGVSPAMKAVFDLVDRVAHTDASILITGESGTGKELIARAIHARSKRAQGPFVAINCSAVPEALLESELFGHAKGAFTDAKSARSGLFVQANGGTFLLDEVADMALSLQPKLLRALQDHRIRPVGHDAEIPFDARIIAATNRDIEAAVDEARFREDLFYRINVIHIPLPPLRARGTDILLIAQHFIDSVSAQANKRVVGLSSSAAEKMMSYTWPGNVRELQNAMERAVALTQFERIVVEDLPEKIRNYRQSQIVIDSGDPAELVPLEEVERRYILRVLEALAGNRTLAARTLGLDRKTLYRKLQHYGVAPENK